MDNDDAVFVDNGRVACRVVSCHAMSCRVVSFRVGVVAVSLEGGGACNRIDCLPRSCFAVSYTHLTLPTIYSV